MKKGLQLTWILFGVLFCFSSEVRAQYCIPTYSTGCSKGDSINYFQFGTSSWTPGCKDKFYKGKTYKGYDSTGIVIPVYRGKTYPITVAMATSTNNYGVWIDFNHDNDFDDSGEVIIVDDSRTDSLINKITIPYKLKLGNYAMRIMSAYNAGVNFINNTSACSTSALTEGETMDYILNVKALGDDASLESILSPNLYMCAGSSQSIKVVVRNRGYDTVASVPVVFVINGTTYNDTLKKKMPMDEQDTLTFPSASISFSSAGTYAFKAYINLPSDSDRTNDTIAGSIIVSTTPTAPTGLGATLCSTGKATLIASSSTTGTVTHWYASTTSDTDLFEGDTFVTGKLSKPVTYYAESQILKWDSIGTDTVLTSSNVRSNNGNMFDITAKADIQIDSFYVDCYTSTKDQVEVYYREGSYVGNETKSKAWTLVGKDSIYGASYGNLVPAFVRFKTPFKAGHTYGIYIRLAVSTLAYNVGSKVYTNPELILKTGNSVSGKFGTPPTAGSAYVTPRNWNGKVFYHIVTCPSGRTPVSVSFSTLKSGFTYTNSCTGTSFKDTSVAGTGASVTGWKWDFGDTTTSTLQNPVHNYKTSGTKTVKLIAYISGGCKDSVSKTISVVATPKADFSISSPSCLGDSTHFTNTTITNGLTTTYSWDFGDTSTSTTTSPSHKYKSAKTYTVKLILTATGGCSDTLAKTVSINIKPFVRFGYTSVCNKPIVTFIDSSFVSGGGTYSWHFGDGSSGTAQNPVHTYASDTALYSATMKLTSTKGCSDSVTRSIKFYTGFRAKFAYTDTCSGNATVFKNMNVTTGASYAWNFGDGTKITAKDTSHVYSAAGNYTVSLIAMNKNGCYDTLSKVIKVLQSPDASFHDSAIGFQKFIFIPKDTTLKNFTWKFGDGGSNGVNIKPVHSYKSNSVHHIALTAQGANGCFASGQDSTVVMTGTLSSSLVANHITVYPNPFRDNTMISYTLDNSSNVELRIYDMTGRVIATLVNENEAEGLHSAVFEPSKFKVAPGVYLLKINIGNGAESKQLIYVK